MYGMGGGPYDFAWRKVDSRSNFLKYTKQFEVKGVEKG
jgi:hypothetical protein